MPGKKPHHSTLNSTVRRLVHPHIKSWHSTQISVVGRKTVIRELKKMGFDVSGLDAGYAGRKRTAKKTGQN